MFAGERQQKVLQLQYTRWLYSHACVYNIYYRRQTHEPTKRKLEVIWPTYRLLASTFPCTSKQQQRKNMMDGKVITIRYEVIKFVGTDVIRKKTWKMKKRDYFHI